MLKSSRILTDGQSFPLPVPSPGYRVSGKEVEVRDSGSRHHQLCGCFNLQLIQSHVAPSHGPPARVLYPLFFRAKSLLLHKPRGNKEHPKTTWSSFLSSKTAWSSPFSPQTTWSSFSSKTTWSSLLSFRTVWSSSPFQNHMALFLSLRTTWSSLSYGCCT